VFPSVPLRRRGLGLKVISMNQQPTASHQATPSISDDITSTLENITDGFMRFDGHWKLVYANAEAARIDRRPRASLLGKSLWELWPGVIGTQLEAEYRRVVMDQVTVQFENFYQPWNRWFAIKAFPAEDGLCVYFNDITDRKQAEQALRLSEEKYRTLFESIDEGFCIIEFFDGPHGPLSDYVHVEANPAYTINAGIPDIVGRKVRELVPDEAEEWVKIYRNVLVTGQPVRFERELVATGRHLDLAAFRIEPAERRQVAVLFKDITQRKQAEERLREADRRKDEFLATLAHELRNPLAPIRTGLQVMKLAGDNAAVIEKTRRMMERQVSQMAHLLDDLLDLSRISQGKITLQTNRLRLADALQDAVDAVWSFMEERDHDLVLDVPDEPIYVDGDRTRLSQVFVSLLNNAAKYTEGNGRIKVTMERQSDDVVVVVQDNGVGIPVSMLPKVFDIFTQVDRSLEKSQGGLGIGLSIVKQLVEMHGGQVAAESDGHRQGSRFTVRLPAIRATLITPSGKDSDELPKVSARRRILVADDNRDAATSLAMLLRILGNETQTAHDGLEALEVAAEFKPDVVLLDIGMPNLNGFDACRRIRREPWGKKIVIVACTGWGQDEDRRKSQDAGFDIHMVKPIDPAVLEKLLAELPATEA
jgi:PAS domain S-box-containing protein